MAQLAIGVERKRSDGLSFCIAYEYKKKSLCATRAVPGAKISMFV
jgi:hypothetical protein